MDTDDIATCPKCGILFDITITLKLEKHYCEKDTRHGKCPVCKEELNIW